MEITLFVWHQSCLWRRQIAVVKCMCIRREHVICHVRSLIRLKIERWAATPYAMPTEFARVFNFCERFVLSAAAIVSGTHPHVHRWHSTMCRIRANKLSVRCTRNERDNKLLHFRELIGSHENQEFFMEFIIDFRVITQTHRVSMRWISSTFERNTKLECMKTKVTNRSCIDSMCAIERQSAIKHW